MTVVMRAPRIELPDPTFAAWTEGSLLWLADKGMGYLPVKADAELVYGNGYFDKYVGYARTALGRRLSVLRIELLSRHGISFITPAHTIIDVGIGCGDFIERAAETWQEQIYGFDVNRAAVEWLTDRGLYRDPRAAPFDVATFWDSLEHIPDVHRIIENVTGWVFCSLPIFRDAEHVLASKHFRPDEHCFYWTREGLIAWMAAQDFICVEHNTGESIVGREDVGSFAFRRVQ